MNINYDDTDTEYIVVRFALVARVARRQNTRVTQKTAVGSWHSAQTMCQTLNGKWCVIVFSDSIVFKIESFNMSPKWRRIDDFTVSENVSEFS